MNNQSYISIKYILAIATEYMVAVIPNIFLLMIASATWPIVASDAIDGKLDPLSAAILFCVPAGWLGIIGLSVLGLFIVNNRKISVLFEVSVFFVALGVAAAILAGYFSFFSLWWSTVIIVAPILVGIHFIYLYQLLPEGT